MTQYSSTVWPAMIYPESTQVTGNGGTAEPPVSPPTVYTESTLVTKDAGFGTSTPVQTTYIYGNNSQAGVYPPHAFFAHLGPARAATTGALPAYTAVSSTHLVANANGAFPITDGVTLEEGQILLVKDESGADAPNNGVYVLFKIGDAGLPWELERTAIDPQICLSDVKVLEGSTNGGTFWVFATDSATFTLGATDIIWQQAYEQAYSNDPPRTGAPPFWVRVQPQ